jgi:hypothetical protein
MRQYERQQRKEKEESTLNRNCADLFRLFLFIIEHIITRTMSASTSNAMEDSFSQDLIEQPGPGRLYIYSRDTPSELNRVFCKKAQEDDRIRCLSYQYVASRHQNFTHDVESTYNLGHENLPWVIEFTPASDDSNTYDIMVYSVRDKSELQDLLQSAEGSSKSKTPCYQEFGASRADSAIDAVRKRAAPYCETEEGPLEGGDQQQQQQQQQKQKQKESESQDNQQKTSNGDNLYKSLIENNKTIREALKKSFSFDAKQCNQSLQLLPFAIPLLWNQGNQGDCLESILSILRDAKKQADDEESVESLPHYLYDSCMNQLLLMISNVIMLPTQSTLESLQSMLDQHDDLVHMLTRGVKRVRVPLEETSLKLRRIYRKKKSVSSIEQIIQSAMQSDTKHLGKLLYKIAYKERDEDTDASGGNIDDDDDEDEDDDDDDEAFEPDTASLSHANDDNGDNNDNDEGDNDDDDDDDQGDDNGDQSDNDNDDDDEDEEGDDEERGQGDSDDDDDDDDDDDETQSDNESGDEYASGGSWDKWSNDGQNTIVSSV